MTSYKCEWCSDGQIYFYYEVYSDTATIAKNLIGNNTMVTVKNKEALIQCKKCGTRYGWNFLDSSHLTQILQMNSIWKRIWRKLKKGDI